ncbi:hypothetical protein Ddc_19805 [Ditylenchus destructor]|nr:hypothetical protein Ddc_19805 [Ditylenchus destructor]
MGACPNNPGKDGHKFDHNCPTLLKASTSVPNRLNEVTSMPSTSSEFNGISARVQHRGAYIIRKNTFDVQDRPRHHCTHRVRHRPSVVYIRRRPGHDGYTAVTLDQNGEQMSEETPMILIASPVEEDYPHPERRRSQRPNLSTRPSEEEDDTISMAEDEQPSVVRQNLLGPLSFDDLYYT